MRSLKQSWLDQFLAWIEGVSESPRIFHMWAAATVVGACAKRNCWVSRGDWNCFPNMYTVLVGHTGLGKGRSINPVVGLLRESGTANVLSDKLTIQHILERLSDHGESNGAVEMHGTTLTFSHDASCLISSPELEDLIMSSETMAPLKELWEAKDGPFEYGTRSKGLVKIHKPCPSLLGGCTPSQVAVLFPPTTIGGGFVRRINFVYASERSKPIPWPLATNGSDDHKTALVEGLKEIAQLRGEFQFTDQARQRFGDYYCESKATEFADEATASYETTKPIHALKLSECLSLARCELVIDEAEMALAIEMVNQCAEQLRHVFRGVGASELATVTDKVLAYIEARQSHNYVTTRSDLLAALWKDVGTWQNLDVILSTLESGNLIYTKQIGSVTTYRWRKGDPHRTITTEEAQAAHKAEREQQ